jgi:predicted anti-sigma-YlaC factor YlaD
MATGCSTVRRAVVGDVSKSAAEAAASSFARENDLMLVAEAMPFALKTLDMLALQNPNDAAIQLAAARAYILYSNIALDWEARKLASTDMAAADRFRLRAVRLYLRGRDYAAAALALSHPDPLVQLAEDPESFLSRMTADDVPALFWLGAGWAASIVVNPSDIGPLANAPLIEAVMRRVLALDSAYELGAIHEFFVLYDGSRSPSAGGDPERAEAAFAQALAISQGRLASPYVALATSLMVQQQDHLRYRALLEQALAIDPDAFPDLRLANTIAQEKARWYLEHLEDYFLIEEGDDP